MDSLIRTRINENLLKVKDESSDVKSMLSLGVQSSNIGAHHDASTHIDILNNIDIYSRHTSRHDLLRTAIILATSRNTLAQENLIDVVRLRLGKIKDKDYKFVADLIYLKNPIIVDKVNKYLCLNLPGYDEMYRKYYKQYYAF